MSVLRATGLHVARGGREVLAGIDLELPAGRIVVVVGAGTLREEHAARRARRPAAGVGRNN